VSQSWIKDTKALRVPHFVI